MESACELLLYRTYFETWQRGADYFNQKRVAITSFDNNYVEATVRGTKTYQLKLGFRSNGLSRNCSCPVRDLCKHMVAAALAWDQLRNLKLPSKQEVENNTIPSPLISYSDIEKAFNTPLSTDLEIIRIAAQEIGSWSRPHVRLPSTPQITIAPKQPVTLTVVKAAFTQIKSWSRKSSYDPYFCAGEMVAGFCEVLRLVINKVKVSDPLELAKILREAQKFNYDY